MADLVYADFDYYTTGNAEVVQTIASPLLGNGSLRVRRVPGGGAIGVNFVAETPAFGDGFIRGRLRMLVAEIVQPASFRQFGMTCMQSQRDISNASGTFYACYLGNNRVSLSKWSGGLLGVSSELALADSSAIIPGTGTNALQLDWLYSADLGGTALVGYHGVATDFSDLVEVVSYQDGPTSYTTSVAQGGFVHDGSGFDFTIHFDHMRLRGSN